MNVLVVNLTTKGRKVYHHVVRTWWDDDYRLLRVRSWCQFANGRALTSASRALVHIDHAKKFAKPCSHCFPDGDPR